MFSFPSELISYLNGVLIIWFLVDLYFAYKNGLLMLIVNFVGSLVAFFIAWLFSPVFAEIYQFVKASGNGIFTIQQTMSAHVNRWVWLVLLFVIIKVLLMIITPLVKIISKIPLVKQVNSFIGAFFGVLLFGVKLSVLAYFLTLPIITNGQDIIDHTFLSKWVELSAPVVSQFDDFINTNTGIQNILRHQELSPEQHDAMVKWLKENGFNENEITEFLSQDE